MLFPWSQIRLLVLPQANKAKKNLHLAQSE
jgi:hypothetical protein